MKLLMQKAPSSLGQNMIIARSPIKETLVKKIIAKYFEYKSIPAIQQKGAGPDFLLEGKAIEVKGSDADFRKALRQFCDYVEKYRGLDIVLPADLLNAENLLRLHFFCSSVWEHSYKYVEVYLICEGDEYFYVKHFRDGKSILPAVISFITSEKLSPTTIKRIIKSRFSDYLKEYLARLVEKERSQIIPKSEIMPRLPRVPEIIHE